MGRIDYFVCEKRKDDDSIEFENNLGRPEYLEKAKRCCELKQPELEERPIDITCPECDDTFLGWRNQEGELCSDCYASHNYFK
jgi:protein-arginine kinase activator protein McsA